MAARRDPPLTTTEIVAAAQAVTRREGLEAVTMRSVAGELDVTPMALYHHIGEKGTLVDLVADAVMSEVSIPPSDEWDRWLATYHKRLRRHLALYPGVAAHLLAQPSTPAAAAIRRQTVDVLVGAGFDERNALLAAATFHTHLFGRLAVESQLRGGSRPDEPDWRAHGLTGKDYVEFGLETLIAGLRAQLSRKSRPRIKRTGR
jgi:AcrR family transcriptional regulator